VFSVTSAADNGLGTNTGSLSWAITQVNSYPNAGVDTIDFNSYPNAGVDTIDFNIPGTGPFTITPASALPDLSHPTFIDGESQRGYSGVPIIQIQGLTLAAGSDGSTISGLCISGFNSGVGIDIKSDNNLVQGNLIDGKSGDGVLIDGDGLNHDTIGGSTSGASNTISGNAGNGVEIGGYNGDDNLVQGNQIYGNSGDGVLIAGYDPYLNTICDNTIGGSTTGNSGNGVEIAGSNGDGNLVQGNLIDGSSGDGVLIDGDDPNHDTIGGSTSGASNTIEDNSGNGVEIAGSYGNDNLVQGNLIGSNSGNGVEIGGYYGNGNLVQGNLIEGNAGDGVLIGGDCPNHDTIGGSTSGTSNTIEDNSGNGVEIVGSGMGIVDFNGNDNLVQGNQLTGNSGDGVFIGSGEFSNMIGGTAAEARNTISGNFSNGVEIAGICNTVQGNFIGDLSGKNPNVGNGVLLIAQAGGNTIGGTTDGAGNIISDNDGNGVQIFGSIEGRQLGGGDNTVQGNYIGTDVTGTRAVPNGQDGVSIIGANNPEFELDITVSGNLISGNEQDGISLDSSTGIQIEGNSIGTDQSGTSPLANGQDGVAVSNVNVVSTGQNGNTIGGTTPGTRNVISGNHQCGILIQSSTETLVEGNYIGTDQKGSLSLPNNNQQDGILVLNSGGPNTIGGTVPGSCNVISGNGNGNGNGNGCGVLLALSSSTLIEGNLIGTDVTGQSALGNPIGVLFVDSQLNTVGGNVAGAENVISGNTSCGIEIIGSASSTCNQVLGNRIGPVLSGDKAFRSESTDPRNPWLQPIGVLIIDSVGNKIGSTTATSGNVIAGNDVGVEIAGSNTSLSGSYILGNDIGIASDGTAIGNVIGIWVDDVPSTQIGGTGSGEGNTISGNSEVGVYISGADATKNMVQGNTIGTIGPGPSGQTVHEKDPTYQFPIGVYIESSSSNTIGGAGSGAGNTISGNSVGVYIYAGAGSSQGNIISGNVINSNERYGILLYNAPSNSPTDNMMNGNKIAKFREFSGPVPMQPSSSGQASGSKAKKPAHHSNHVAHQSPQRTALQAQVTAHGHTVPAGPLRKPRDRVRH
jgi:parallel beta-helix repeat protein